MTFEYPANRDSLIYEPEEQSSLAGTYSSWGYFTVDVAHVISKKR